MNVAARAFRRIRPRTSTTAPRASNDVLSLVRSGVPGHRLTSGRMASMGASTVLIGRPWLPEPSTYPEQASRSSSCAWPAVQSCGPERGRTNASPGNFGAHRVPGLSQTSQDGPAASSGHTGGETFPSWSRPGASCRGGRRCRPAADPSPARPPLRCGCPLLTGGPPPGLEYTFNAMAVSGSISPGGGGDRVGRALALRLPSTMAARRSSHSEATAVRSEAGASEARGCDDGKTECPPVVLRWHSTGGPSVWVQPSHGNGKP